MAHKKENQNHKHTPCFTLGILLPKMFFIVYSRRQDLSMTHCQLKLVLIALTIEIIQSQASIHFNCLCETEKSSAKKIKTL